MSKSTISTFELFIRRRGEDIHQNAIVGVFLRLLEYYRGVIFMTSNRDIETAIDKALELGINSPDGAVIVIPSDGIGTGLAELDKRAPKTFAYLQQRLAELEKE